MLKEGQYKDQRLCFTPFQYSLRIEQSILDSVHGLIGLSAVESIIEHLPIFKRLHDVSQLGLTNRIFPCALHNRYIHSLGVMYVADQMAMQLRFSDNERQLLRLAALLHDIGHYPMSHDVEKAYMDNAKAAKGSEGNVQAFVESMVATKQIAEQKSKAEEINLEHFEKKSDFHHEEIGKYLVEHSVSIKEAIIENFILKDIDFKHGTALLNDAFKGCTSLEDAIKCVVQDIGNIITGNISHNTRIFQNSYAVMIQLMHSELDADNIDYLLRDAAFSGTTYGLLDMGLLIRSLDDCEKDFALGATYPRIAGLSPSHNGKTALRIVGVMPKGVGCAEQFFLNRYFAYYQVIHHKYTMVLSHMLRHVILWLLNYTNASYQYRELYSVINNNDAQGGFLTFTDGYIIDVINRVSIPNNASDKTKVIFKTLREFHALNMLDEEKCIDKKTQKMLEKLERTPLFIEMASSPPEPWLYLFETKRLAKQITQQISMSCSVKKLFVIVIR